MKKIMFNDKYGLTDAVLNGRKTMTRRKINLLNFDPRQDWIARGNNDNGKANIAVFHNETYKYSIYPRYQLGEVVAVAQRYCDLAWDARLYDKMKSLCDGGLPQYQLKGWDNKMFVRADLMPHQIEITDIKVERLQDISDEDCLKEGIIRRDDMINSRMEDVVRYTFENSFVGGVYKTYATPREAFAALIERPGIGHKGDWSKNPWVVVYSFKLIK